MTEQTLTSRIFSKLKSTQGFMLGEQLLSIIFIGLLCIAVTAGLSAAMTAFGNISRSTESQALLNRAVQQVSDELAFSRGGTGLAFESESVHALVELKNVSGGIAFKGKGIKTGEPNDGEQEVLFIPGTSDGLVPEVTYRRDENNNDLWKYTVRVKSNENVVAETQEMTVARVGN